jgi:hypothetical protein
MKRVNLSITKCTNPKCKEMIISELVGKVCPICKSKLLREGGYKVQFVEEAGDCQSFITLKKKNKKGK